MSGEYEETVCRGLEWLASQQHDDGRIGQGGETTDDHAIATCAFVEAAVLAPYPELVRRARMAAVWLGERGEGSRPWAALALCQAEDAGLRLDTAPGTVASRQPESGEFGGSILVAFLRAKGRRPEIPEEWVSRAIPELEAGHPGRRFMAFAGFFQMRRPEWDRAERGLRALVPLQVRDGGMGGSWLATEPGVGDRTTTAFTVMSLQTWYRWVRTTR